MSTNGTNTGPGDEGFVHADGGETPARRADELFVHGLLGSLNEGDAKERRLAALARALDGGETAAHAVGRLRRNSGRRLRRLAGLATVTMFAIAGVLLVMPAGQSAAYATVKATIAAAQSPEDRRYEVRVVHAGETDFPKDANAILDSRAGGQFLLRFWADREHLVVVGKDQSGTWAIRREGGVDREHAREAWPRWSTVHGESLFADSIGDLLQVLTKDYELTTSEGELVDGMKLTKVVGERKADVHRQPDVIELWIDPKTNVLERMEMRWPPVPAGGRGRPGGGPEGPVGGVRGDPEREGAADAARERPRLEGRPEDREGPPPPREGAGDERTEGPRGPGRRGPGDGPPRGEGPHDGPPPEREGDRPAGDHGGDGPPRGERGPEGRTPPPWIPPWMRPPASRPPLQRLVIQRVKAPEFAEGWFTPEKHDER